MWREFQGVWMLPKWSAPRFGRGQWPLLKRGVKRRRCRDMVFILGLAGGLATFPMNRDNPTLLAGVPKCGQFYHAVLFVVLISAINHGCQHAVYENWSEILVWLWAVSISITTFVRHAPPRSKCLISLGSATATQ